MTGGLGADHFGFNRTDSGNTAATCDLIQDGASGYQPLRFIRYAAFSALGQVRFSFESDHTIVEVKTLPVAQGPSYNPARLPHRPGRERFDLCRVSSARGPARDQRADEDHQGLIRKRFCGKRRQRAATVTQNRPDNDGPQMVPRNVTQMTAVTKTSTKLIESMMNPMHVVSETFATHFSLSRHIAETLGAEKGPAAH